MMVGEYGEGGHVAIVEEMIAMMAKVTMVMVEVEVVAVIKTKFLVF